MGAERTVAGLPQSVAADVLGTSCVLLPSELPEGAKTGVGDHSQDAAWLGAATRLASQPQ